MHDGGHWILDEDGKMERTVEIRRRRGLRTDAGNNGVLSAQLIWSLDTRLSRDTTSTTIDHGDDLCSPTTGSYTGYILRES